MNIRQARPEDAAMLAEFGRRLFWEAYRGYTADEKLIAFMNQRYTHENFFKIISDPTCPTFLAENDHWKGYASIELNRNNHASVPPDSSPAYLSLLYVDQEYHGQGIGATLLDHVCEEVKARGKDYLWLSVWKITRSPGFYRRMGFGQIGEIPFTYPDGSFDIDWVMGKWL